MNKIIYLIGICILFLQACGSEKSEVIKHDEAFTHYITAYTSNVISSRGEVVVRLASELKSNYQPEKRLFHLEPTVDGSEIWLDERTVAFRPSDKFKNGTHYRVQFNLTELVDSADVPGPFQFDFETLRQDMEVSVDGITTPDPGERSKQHLIGTIYTADAAELSEMKNVLTARQGGYSLPIEWEQDPNLRTHHFTITDIKRSEKTGFLKLSWSGQPIGTEVRGSQQIEITPLGEFELVRTHVIRDVNPHIELTFSDPIDPNQNLQGLFRIGSYDQFNVIVKENKVELYPRKKLTGEKTLTISEGIRNRDGNRIGQELNRTVYLHQLKPQVKFVGSGVIIPQSDELLLPIEAVSLGAIDVQVTRIFENNITQFLQFNNLSGGTRLNYVGRPIVQEVIPLSSLGAVDPGSWNGYALDLSKLIKPEPGAIYQVKVGFRKHQIVYPCADQSVSTLSNRSWVESPEQEERYWNRFDGYYYPPNYSWRERDNPCHSSYYSSRRHIDRNVLSSDLGLIAKQGEVGALQVFVTDLQTAQPKSGVNIDLYDFQQQHLASITSDRQGMAQTETDRKPYLLVARDGDQRGYLRMDDGSSLSLSDFDVSGVRVNDGIKGFLYGERGVWRPGDSLFVTLITEDKNDVIPDDHPVTFELTDPDGRSIDRQVLDNPVSGIYSYRTKTDHDAPTGNWLVTARYGGNTFSKRVSIETVKPNRLKVNLDLNDQRLTAENYTLDGSISARWLHGATAKNMNTDISMTIFERTPRFADYGEYSFDDPIRNIDAPTEEIFKGKLNNKGFVDFSYEMKNRKNVPGLLSASLLTRVFEPSGNFSVNRSSINYYPYPVMIGLRFPEYRRSRPWLERDSTHTLDVVTVDVDGKPVSRSGLEVKIYKVNWSWWWEKSHKNLSQYFSRRNIQPVVEKTITTGSNGKGQVNFKIDDYRWGRFIVRVTDPDGGHAAGRIFYLGWSYYRSTNAGNPARLSLETDKESYEVGEEITLNIPSGAGGRALVSLETGSKILRTFWTDTNPGETRVTFLANREMSPNVYAYVQMLQPHGQNTNDRPIRMYGVVPIEVKDPQTILEPVADLPSELRPETQTTIRIGEANDRPMSYTIAMVDEGLLDLTNFRTPKPWNHFYAREALGVRTWDLFNYVADAYAGTLNRILSIGGDQELERPDEPTEVNRFKPMVRYLGPFHLEAGKTNSHTIEIPNYVGSVRTMVIAAQDGAYGQAELTTPVRKPVMVLGTLPRVLGPGETVSLPVSVFTMKEYVKEVKVGIRTNDIIKIRGPSEKVVSFEEPGEKPIWFELEVESRTGAGKVQIDVEGGGERAHHDIDIAVRNPNPPVTNVFDKVLEPGQTWTFEYAPVGLGGTNSGVFEVSRIPPIDLARRLRYLIRYPHGCIEQVTSSVFPQLHLDRIMDLSDERKQQIQKNVDGAIKKLQSFLTPEGGLGYWPDHHYPSEWGTNYGFHFLLEAKKKGYYVPSDLLDNVAVYQRRRAVNWRFNKERSRYDDLTQAYRLYTLALNNTPELGAMNRLRERESLTVQALWRLAAAYVLAGQPEAADNLVKNATTEISRYRQLRYTYGSHIRDKAMILETLSIMDRREKAAHLMKEVAEALNERRWMSTQTTAYSLIAVARFLQIAEGAEVVEVQYDITNAGEGSIQSKAPISQIPFDIPDEENQRVQVTNNSDGIVFARLIQEGIPLIGDKTAASNFLVQEVRYLTPDGTEVNPQNLDQGMDFIAEVTVRNPGTKGRYDELVLSQIFPSGWEIRNTRMDDIKFKEPTSRPDYQDIRDDRVYTYFDLGSNRSATFRIMLNSSYTGRYYLPTISTSAMYDESINARTPGTWVRVQLPDKEDSN